MCLVILVLLQVAPSVSWAESWTRDVPGTANLYGAGHAAAPVTPDGGGAGTLPPGVVLPVGAHRILRITATSGAIRYSPSLALNGPDGVASSLWIGPDWAGISGCTVNRIRELAGVFLDDSEPADPPPAKLMIDDLSAFHVMVVGLRQIFAIGDGLMGTAMGDTQTVVVPAGATRLYLGFMDSFSGTWPGWYGDNSGSLSVEYSVVAATQTEVPDQIPRAGKLHQNAPNPFNPRTTIRFDLPTACPVRLAVYDLAGRLVRILVEGKRAAGSYEAVWDGRDQSGRSAPSGTYLARQVAGGKVKVVRMSLVQ